jgi:hypothetical protein
MATIPSLTDSKYNPYVVGQTAVQLGLSLQSQRLQEIAGARLGNMLQVMGGATQIAGASIQMGAYMPAIASIPMGITQGAVIGSTIGGATGAVLGGVLGLAGSWLGAVSRRRAREEQEGKERDIGEQLSRAHERQTIEYGNAIQNLRDKIPLIAEERERVEANKIKNMALVDQNIQEIERVRAIQSNEIRRLTDKALSNFKLGVAYSGLAYEGSAWYLSGEVEDVGTRKIQEAEHQASVKRQEQLMRRSEIEGQATGALAELGYAEKLVGRQIEHTRDLLRVNMDELQANKYSSALQRQRARTALAMAGATETLVNKSTREGERSYFTL